MSLVTLKQLDGTETRIKKSAAKMLARRLEIEKVGPHLYQALVIRPAESYARPVPASERPYIPTKMPSPEIPGLRFKQSAKALAMQASSLVTGIRRIRREWATA